LLVSIPDRCIFVRRVFQLDNSKRQAIDEDDDIRPAFVLVLDNSVLIDREPVIRVWVVEVNDFHYAVNQTRTLTLRFAMPSPTGRGPG
jgi:hypothetical protein